MYPISILLLDGLGLWQRPSPYLLPSFTQGNPDPLPHDEPNFDLFNISEEMFSVGWDKPTNDYTRNGIKTSQKHLFGEEKNNQTKIM